MPVSQHIASALKGLLLPAMMLCSLLAYAHGDVTPQAVDVSTLEALGDEMREVNPYRGNEEAIRIGSSAYNQNCARCHGLEAISGGIAPDLRKLDMEPETDEYFLSSVLRGKVRNGNVYMPPFEGIMSQEAIWAIRSYVDVRAAEFADSGSGDMSATAQLAQDSGCMSCHEVDIRMVGPAYTEVADKYANDPQAEATLLEKIKAGGSGGWGDVPMPPMASVGDDNIKALVKWILQGAK